MPNQPKIILEPAAQKFADDNSKPPFLPDLGPEKGRETVDTVQSSEIYKPEVEIEDLMVPGGPNGNVSIRIVRPPSSSSASLPVILYIHGAGWVFGNAHTHDRLIRELAVGAEAAIVFPNYSLSPEAKYPTAIEEIYAVLKWIAAQGSEHALDASKLSIGGDSVGGNMAAAMRLWLKNAVARR